ncbi:hypothetical protein B9Z55_024739 [Caenorhabditis nigoni]|uniref:Uncharacterized protein n=1 Tax=Caenorhabditis nigoni TaxID=1611254 RepID=A0A2G5SVU5_9PELO|nr:hypothetical protein B9Z55_024739 [Caenorhabditis nigoni]
MLTVAELQWVLRLILFSLSTTIVFCYGMEAFIEYIYPKIVFPPGQSAYCYPKDPSEVSGILGSFRTIDMILSIIITIPCFILLITTSFPNIHYPITIICAARLFLLGSSLVHASSQFNRNTPLDFIYAVTQKVCHLDESQEKAYSALLVSYVFRGLEGVITFYFITFAFVNSVLICMFGLGHEQNQPRKTEEAAETHELEELPTRRTHLSA